MIKIDIIDRTGEYRQNWRMIGICPETVSESGGLHVYRPSRQQGRPAIVRDSTTDDVLCTGKSLNAVLQQLADLAGMPVGLYDDATDSLVDTFHPND